MSTYLEAIPKEILIVVLSYADLADLNNLKQIYHVYKLLANENTFATMMSYRFPLLYLMKIEDTTLNVYAGSKDWRNLYIDFLVDYQGSSEYSINLYYKSLIKEMFPKFYDYIKDLILVTTGWMMNINHAWRDLYAVMLPLKDNKYLQDPINNNDDNLVIATTRVKGAPLVITLQYPYFVINKDKVGTSKGTPVFAYFRINYNIYDNYLSLFSRNDIQRLIGLLKDLNFRNYINTVWPRDLEQNKQDFDDIIDDLYARLNY